MSRINFNARTLEHTHEGAAAAKLSPLVQLRRQVLTCLLWEDTFYEAGSAIAASIAEAAAACKASDILQCAVEARTRYGLRHAPLYLLCLAAKRSKEFAPLEFKGAVQQCLERADEPGELLAMYWHLNGSEAPLPRAFVRGIALAMPEFTAYQLAKYNRDATVKLKDVLFLTHPKPRSESYSYPIVPADAVNRPPYMRGRTRRDNGGQGLVWQQLIEGTLASPDTWEVELSAGKDKKATFERLLAEGKLGGMACLRNLRGMLAEGVDEVLIRKRLADGLSRVWPYRFITAAKYAPTLEDALEAAMFKGLEEMPKLDGVTGILIDVSGSMIGTVSAKSESSRIDVACGLAILCRELASECRVATFASNACAVAPRRGFALRDAVMKQFGGATRLGASLRTLQSLWPKLDRLIVITDGQTEDGIITGWATHNYMINVAPYRNAVQMSKSWVNIDGWSERVLDYIRESEAQ